MKINKLIYGLILFAMFLPRVYAFTFDFDISHGNTVVNKGTVDEINVTLKNIQGLSDSLCVCYLYISLDGGVALNGSVKSGAGWEMMSSDVYLFNTTESFINGAKMFSIPIKVNDAGSLKISNIKCSDGENESSISDRFINYSIKENNNNSEKPNNSNDSKPTVDNPSVDNKPNNDNKEDEVIELDGTVTDIVLSEGSINFASDVYEYNVEVSDFTQLNVTVEYTGSVSYTIDKLNENGNKFIVISIGEDGAKSYRINVNELTDNSTVFEPLEEKNDDNNNVTLIFMIIIGILVLLNIFRVARKFRKS